jgi:hypothetical protein
MDRMARDDAATLLTLLRRGKQGQPVRGLLPGWDMLQADVPSRERVEAALSILVGSGLAEVDATWAMRPTERGEQLRRSVKGGGGMRWVPAAIGVELQKLELSCATLSLPHEVFDAARADYLSAAERRAKRRSQPFWWWPSAFRPGPTTPPTDEDR